MKKVNLTCMAACSFLVILFTGCIKNDTNFYEDADNKGLSILSNRGNNIMSCYVQNQSWITDDRILTSGFALGRPVFEIYISSEVLSPTERFLNFSW